MQLNKSYRPFTRVKIGGMTGSGSHVGIHGTPAVGCIGAAYFVVDDVGNLVHRSRPNGR